MTITVQQVEHPNPDKAIELIARVVLAGLMEEETERGQRKEQSPCHFAKVFSPAT